MVFFDKSAIAAVMLIVGRLASSSSEFPANIRLLAVGGRTDLVNETSDVDVISVSNNDHTAAAKLLSGLTGFGKTVINNTFYIVGGWHPGLKAGLKTFRSFDVSANTWTTLPDFPVNILRPAVVAVDNVIYVLGGIQVYPAPILTKAYKYELNTGAWKQIATYWPQDDVYVDVSCALVYENQIYLLFENGDLFRSTDAVQTWTKLASMSHGRSYPSCVTLSTGKIVVAGGSADRPDDSQTTANEVEVYDIISNSWSIASVRVKDRELADAVVIPKSSGEEVVVVCGGFYKADEDSDDYKVWDDCELFSQTNNKWVEAAFSLNMPRFEYGLFVTHI